MEESTIGLIEGKWVGGYEHANEWQYVEVRFREAAEGMAATIDMPLKGAKDLIATAPAVEPPHLRFELQRDGVPHVFNGERTGSEIVGDVMHGDLHSALHLIHVADVDPPVADHYLGTYHVPPDRFIFIGNLLGSLLQAYHDFSSGRIGALFPTAQATFVAGPALLVPAPVDVEIAFINNDQDRAAGLVWQQRGCPPLAATRLRLTHEEVSFRNGDVTLAGTVVTLPRTGPHPAVVLIHGSGPQPRNCVRSHADFFARHGIATLMYDKRGVGASTGNWEEASFADLANDALAGVRFLQSRPDINAAQVGLWGGSQGGWLAPLAASQSQDVAFIVLCAGPAVSIAEQNVQNVERTLRADGFPEDEIATAVAYRRLFNDLLWTGEGWEAFRAIAERSRDKAWFPYVGDLEQPPSSDDVRAYRPDLELDPVAVLRKVTCPVLALFGESDTVVPAEENKALMEQALRDGDNPDYTIEVLPKATHIMLVNETGSTNHFPRTTHFVKEYFEVMINWILARVDVIS